MGLGQWPPIMCLPGNFGIVGSNPMIPHMTSVPVGSRTQTWEWYKKVVKTCLTNEQKTKNYDPEDMYWISSEYIQ